MSKVTQARKWKRAATGGIKIPSGATNIPSGATNISVKVTGGPLDIQPVWVEVTWTEEAPCPE